MSNPPLVADPESVTPEWITTALHRAGRAVGARVVSFSSADVGTGQMARSVRFTLEWDDDAHNVPASVVGKFPSEDPTSRATGVTQGAYRKEVGFYTDIAASVAVRTPHCWLADIDEKTGDFVLLMEDVSPATQGDQIRGCTSPEAHLALEELAKLHAPRWGDPSLAHLDYLTSPSPEASQLLQAVYGAVFPGFVARYAERLSSEHLGVAERLGGKLVAWSGAVSDGPLSVTHGDYRLDNMLFGVGQGAPPLVVVDWQTVARGVGTTDAAYFLGAGLSVEVRRESERDLLTGYHEALLRGGVTDYPFDDCWRDYRLGTYGGVVMAVVASMIVERTERGDEMFMAMASRHAQHALDLEAETLLG